ncbi:unnamed protein product [Protopolystoma xenopodis]|uniref:Uncharacterized protein n=1 Tax=Protopolystoma xenopodis TaxID=117903 RepID=A0A3S5BWW1_9PLAT|nr:unnamed protein product [Protopolystoma xenopodis]
MWLRYLVRLVWLLLMMMIMLLLLLLLMMMMMMMSVRKAGTITKQTS